MKTTLVASLSLLVPTSFLFADGHGETADPAPTEAAEKKAHEFADVSVDELKQAIAEKAVTVIDVNGAAKYNAGHVPGALHYGTIKGDSFAASLPEDKGALIVSYCSGPS